MAIGGGAGFRLPRQDRPEPRFKDAYKDQEDALTMLATIAGFDLDV